MVIMIDTGIGSQIPNFQSNAPSFTTSQVLMLTVPTCYMQTTEETECDMKQALKQESLAYPWNLAFGGEGVNSAELFLIRLIHQIYSIHPLNKFDLSP